MDYTGLLAKKYRVNRKLTNEERLNRLDQKVRQDIDPFYNISVIKLNSVYLECVDRWFIYRGSATALILIFFVSAVLMLIGPWLLTSSPHLVPTVSDLVWMLTVALIYAPGCSLLMWFFLKESFSWTHFPIRFNYRNKKVYVFRRDGTVLIADWNNMFFTLGRCERTVGQQNWDIRGHVLDEDGETVRETFALPGDTMRVDQLKHCWEFVRRYMEEGPASVYRDVYWCHDIAERREKYKAGLRYMFFSLNGQPIGQILLSPVFFVASLGRWFAMRTSKIPVWPAEIEAECAVEPFDPYLRDASRNPDKIPMEPM
ncbi:hypothetical protein NUV26_02940 [Burkholderia pseudomultivorans]|uniref:DUF6708 domain-containing protein n=1 Tax=Burkholderia pseudomultivorans TaxID=1207504 RepID=UPI000757FC16|nr:DUF6708 domain-containing protein [Burkholderia pseudomultivorans]AOI88100.1 hypothetical protein WS57_04490 [Burkholderia pseudomultivorans]KVC21163.1 hypothetical protein WS55_21225 [Burkholderia pseudomultivorans]KVC34518.1 hypothetical protein WS56_11790 [Burkholderia pseudomultivorans]KVC56745.1 hypothetical protein WS58_29150 [Burkholderia pseudomultivorans]MDS0791096.1 hypothetical protein [Burkholderia pseudomultivorans]